MLGTAVIFRKRECGVSELIICDVLDVVFAFVGLNPSG